MRFRIFLCLTAIVVSGLGFSAALAVEPNAEEMACKARFVEQRLGSHVAMLPFSFVYDGQPSSELLRTWKVERTSQPLDDQRTQITIRFTAPDTGLVVRCEAIEYRDFPTVDWTLYFQNLGSADTPVLEDIQALDTRFERDARDEFMLHHTNGSSQGPADYQPLESELPAGKSLHFAPVGGRGSNGTWPYFNLQWGEEGAIVVVGWPGQWAADFVRDQAHGIQVRAGQEGTHFKLLPGEEVRTPRIVVQFWRGADWLRGQNLWRRWMMAHNMPKPGGKLPAPMILGGCSLAFEEMMKADEPSVLAFLNRWVEKGLRIDYLWMDTGWCPFGKEWWRVLALEPDRQRFPRGLRPISDEAHAKGIKTLAWFDVERVAEDSWLAQNHPEWVTRLPGNPSGLLDLGNPEARAWLVQRVDSLLIEQGIDLYRQDFNIDPLDYWRSKDAADRQGIAEIKHITGYLAYWDELRQRHPNMLIDSCASGGRRNDLETMRRSVPLWRSDYSLEPVGTQCHSYGISLWLPYSGTGTVACASDSAWRKGGRPVEPYGFWSNSCPSVNCAADIRGEDTDFAALRQLFDRFHKIAHHYYGDFYPLLPYSLEKNAWIAWQYDLPEEGEGMVQAFRRSESSDESKHLKLQGLEPAATYVVTDIERDKTWQGTGQELANPGLLVHADSKPYAVVLTYRKVNAKQR